MSLRDFVSTIVSLVMFGAVCGAGGFFLGRIPQVEAWQKLPPGAMLPPHPAIYLPPPRAPSPQ